MLLVLELQDALPPRFSQFAAAFRVRQASTHSSQAWQPPAVQVHNGIESAPHRRDDTRRETKLVLRPEASAGAKAALMLARDEPEQ
jgi:hypothetical protein